MRIVSMARLSDNLGRSIDFTFNNRGLVQEIRGNDGRVANFKYNEKDELIYSKDVDGNTYGYDYDLLRSMQLK